MVKSFTADEAERMNNQKEDTILVRVETSPEDIHGMHAAGILTSRGGMTSHTSCSSSWNGRSLRSRFSRNSMMQQRKNRYEAGEKLIEEGDIVTIDGSNGKVMLGSTYS